MTLSEIDTGTPKMLARVDEGIGWMVYNNPERLNAMSMEMQLAVPRILAAFQDDPDVRTIVITGAGERAFVSGADISEFGERRTSVDARAEYDARMAETWRAWRELEKPVIAMIHGYCMGFGLLVAMQADIRIASEGSEFGVPAARLGLGYAMGGVEQLVALVGPSWASEILFSARRLSSEEALRTGIVNRVVPPGELEPQVRELARTIAGNAPLTVRACKLAIREAMRPPAERDRAKIDALVEACFRSEDYLEGQAAFAEKREPHFRGV
jgi:enoyl-CoA hydratase/carnithine racemase